MNANLNKDEYEALTQISRGVTRKKMTAIISQNAKHLYGLKLISYKRDGSPFITDKGMEVMFLQRCIDGLRAVSLDPKAKLNPEVKMLLAKKGHIKALEEGGFEVTTKGLESLADIASRS